jgi:hypothetical protein
MLPGAGWAKSGRTCSSRINRSSDRPDSHEPNVTLRVAGGSFIADPG